MAQEERSAGPHPVTTKQVAQRAGVSAGTVSNVLNNPHLVTPDTRRRVEEAIAELGFVPNESARQLRRGTSRSIALVVPDLANPFFDDVAAGADDAADARDAMVLVSSSANSAERELRHLRRLAQQRLLGLLITPLDEPPWEVLDEIQSQGTQVVLIDHTPRDRPAATVVTVDDHRGGQLVGEHLIAGGHRHIVYLAPVFQQTEARLAGLRAAIASKTRRQTQTRLEVLRCRDMTIASGVEAATTILERSPGERPSAIFCGNDLIAVGVLNTCARQSVKVPSEVTIVGYDDIAMAATTSVPLSTVRQPRQELGRRAVDLVLGRTGGGSSAVLPPALIVRASSARGDDTS